MTNLSKEGLGIGLWLSRQLIEMQGDTITAQSEGPGTGAELRNSAPADCRGAREVVFHAMNGNLTTLCRALWT